MSHVQSWSDDLTVVPLVVVVGAVDVVDGQNVWVKMPRLHGLGIHI